MIIATIDGIKNIAAIIKFFDCYPQVTHSKNKHIIKKKVFLLMIAKKHKVKGLQIIVAIIASSN